MNMLSKQESHKMEISKQVQFAAENIPFYGSIRLRENNSTGIFQDAIPGLIESISMNNSSLSVKILSGNQKIGRKTYYFKVEDIKSISVDRDKNFKVIYNPNTDQ